MAAANWYYSQDGKQFGPVTFEELKELASSGQLRPVEHVWKEGTPGWISAQSVPNLYGPGTGMSTKVPEEESGGAAEAVGEFAQQAKDKAKAASKDAFAALKIMMTNPVGGIKEAFDQLGEARAMQAGIALAAVFDFCFLIGLLCLLRGHNFFGTFVRGWLVGLVLPFALTGLSAAVRKVLGGAGTWQSDIFVAGASLLPTGLALLVGGILGPNNMDMATLLAIFAGCFTVLMLFSGCTRIMGIGEAKATLAVPVMLVISVWLSTVLFRVLSPSTPTPPPAASTFR